ncbi:MAG: efflux RND transporter periplasmic adaptor subunit [Kiritimatiellae bacterium]|nr:efflux RND transporter periplasmic adaptor subunit [Kiritimatiellia bacterium]
MMKFFILLIVIASAAGGGWYWHKSQKPVAVAIQYRTATIERGTVVQEIRATGTVQPIKEVEVGTQVNGRIIRLDADFNSLVKAGQIVALIDPDVYEANHAKDQAQLKSNEANLEQTKIKLALAEKDLFRKSELASRKMMSQAELDTAQAERDALAAQVKIAEAAVEQLKAVVKQSRTNLEYCTIRSPVDGVVISRNVDEGQTVVSSMNAQQLFKIATDLGRIQVEASIPEADVGQVKTNQTVTFTVDAYRDSFRGAVKQIRLSAATVQNVVTYPVIVEADNPEEKLFPGMTANINVEIDREEHALLVPAAALRFAPTNIVTEIKGPKVWLLNSEGQPEAVKIKPGISDGTHTSVISETDLEGREVVLGFQTSGQNNAGGPRNPFMPTMPGGPGGSRNVRRAMR